MLTPPCPECGAPDRVESNGRMSDPLGGYTTLWFCDACSYGWAIPCGVRSLQRRDEES